MKKAILSTIAVTALLVGCSDSRKSISAKDATAANQFGDLPPAVQTTVKREVPNGIVDRVSTETKNGRLVYKIKFQDQGLNPSIWVTADGNILKSDINRDKAVGATGNASDLNTGSSKDLKFTQLPAKVQKAIRDQAPTAKIADIKRRNRDGRIVYEVSFEDKGTNPSMTIAEDGTIIKDIQK
ncbi:MAG TPA: PepSY-like domain-containing protein [Verrucomicrobiae bacterium]|nr:PepSY-like domain-containing protein [Verrucomicrobiae bacterium]